MWARRPSSLTFTSPPRVPQQGAATLCTSVNHPELSDTRSKAAAPASSPVEQEEEKRALEDEEGVRAMLIHVRLKTPDSSGVWTHVDLVTLQDVNGHFNSNEPPLLYCSTCSNCEIIL